MNTILENEIEKIIGRTPNEDELQSAIKYIDGCSDDLTRANDIPGLLEDWRSDCMVKCTNCGAYHLADDMFSDEDSNELFCDEQCAYEWHNGYTMSQLESQEYRANM